MTLYERYINGQEEQVYEEIFNLGEEAFSPANLPDIEKVLTEIFERVSYNLDIIYTELQHINYQFKTEFLSNYDRPLYPPLPNANVLLDQLDNAVEPFGFVPLSLKYFYKIVGSVNFGWDYETNGKLMWKMADPIQVDSLDSLVHGTVNFNWKEEMEELLDHDENEIVSLRLAADEYHKDNISGGPLYSLQITKQPSIDSRFLNEPNDTTFIDYLRICFEYCGFPGMARGGSKNDYQAFFDKVKPQLKSI